MDGGTSLVLVGSTFYVPTNRVPVLRPAIVSDVDPRYHFAIGPVMGTFLFGREVVDAFLGGPTLFGGGGFVHFLGHVRAINGSGANPTFRRFLGNVLGLGFYRYVGTTYYFVRGWGTQINRGYAYGKGGLLLPLACTVSILARRYLVLLEGFRSGKVNVNGLDHFRRFVV